MKNSKKENKESRTPYEPPRLLNLGGGMAYAQAACKTGGSPGTSSCRDGATATSASCVDGGAAGGTCDVGVAAVGGSCKAGNTATFSCKVGAEPM
ncbi:MAG: hypothetical protein JW896_10245 [Deltaproteobacteria bacterium]|nr:hypothetical protein [Deltaproteobacteria bacterium]